MATPAEIASQLREAADYAAQGWMFVSPELLAIAATLINEQAVKLQLAVDAVPTNWRDPLLSGDSSVLRSYVYTGKDIERLLVAVKRRIEQATR